MAVHSSANALQFVFWVSEIPFGKLLSRQAELDHQAFLALVVDQEMAMEKDVALFLKVSAGNRLAAGTLGIERSGPQNDVLAVEGAVALANGHGGLVRVVPHGGEAVRLGIETGDAGSGGLRSVRVEEGKIRLQKLAVLDHVLLAGAFRHARLPFHGKEGLDDIPVARKLREQFLTRARPVRGLILVVGLLRDGRSGHQQCRDDPFRCGTHGTG
jgi:hypothetical protein